MKSQPTLQIYNNISKESTNNNIKRKKKISYITYWFSGIEKPVQGQGVKLQSLKSWEWEEARGTRKLWSQGVDRVILLVHMIMVITRKGYEKIYASVMDNTGQAIKKPLLRTNISERVDHSCSGGWKLSCFTRFYRFCFHWCLPLYLFSRITVWRLFYLSWSLQ